MFAHNGTLNIHTTQLTSRDTVHDLLQYALERPECCFRTALSVRHKGKRLDDFFEIGSIEDLSDGDTVELVEGVGFIYLELLSVNSLSLSLLILIEPYSQREVRAHVQRLKDLLSTNPLQQAMSCSDGLTLSFLASITITDPEGTFRLTCTCMYMYMCNTCTYFN